MITDQEQYIEQLINEKKEICVFLTNGIKLKGHILRTDPYCFLMGGRTTQLVYKHAVATIDVLQNLSRYPQQARSAAANA